MVYHLTPAYLKGIGMGLARPLDTVTITRSSGSRRCNDPDWRFFSCRTSRAHRMAAALYTAGRGATFDVLESPRSMSDGVSRSLERFQRRREREKVASADGLEERLQLAPCELDPSRW